MADKRKRKHFKFWLDTNDEDDYQLIADIKRLKKARKFTDVIRLGLRLLPPLFPSGKNPKPDYDDFVKRLFEMFPDIKTMLHRQLEADVLEEFRKKGLMESEDMVQYIIELKGMISQIKNQPMVSAAMTGNVTMRRVTTDEEITLEVKQVKGDGNSAQNFLNSMQALQAPAKPQPKVLNVPQFDVPDFEDD